MASIDEFTKYAVRVGIYAQWHKIIFPLYMRFKKLPGLINVRMFAHSKLENRYAKLLSDDFKSDESGPADFVTKLTRIQSTDPSKINKAEIASACTTNIGAGSDTTSISLSAVFFFLYTYPDTLARLRSEINENIDQGLLSDPVKYGESTRMPYLQAVIKEALRMHPATGLILGRVVPKGGQNLAGQYFPEGVSINLIVSQLPHAGVLISCPHK
jgi:cytochrome P450